MAVKPDHWSFKRAEEILGRPEPGNLIQPHMERLAEYVQKHEQPPVDPDVLAVRDILALWDGDYSKALENGQNDTTAAFQSALAAYRKHKS